MGRRRHRSPSGILSPGSSLGPPRLPSRGSSPGLALCVPLPFTPPPPRRARRGSASRSAPRPRSRPSSGPGPPCSLQSPSLPPSPAGFQTEFWRSKMALLGRVFLVPGHGPRRVRRRWRDWGLGSPPASALPVEVSGTATRGAHSEDPDPGIPGRGDTRGEREPGDWG